MMPKMFKINDASQKCGDVVQHAEQFLPFAHKKMGFQKPISINLVSDPKNAKNPLGKTAYYDPNELKITVFVDNRHLKDILRSLAHELVHHTQNCRGDLGGNNYTGPGYAQKDKHMRKMEGEAYLSGNLCFRDWEDSLKGKITMAENKNIDEGGTRGPAGKGMAAAMTPFVDYIKSERKKGKNNKSIYDQISKFVKDLIQPSDDTSNMSAADLLKLTNKTSDEDRQGASDDAMRSNQLARNQNLKEKKAMGIKRNKLKNIKEGMVPYDPDKESYGSYYGAPTDKELDKLKLKRKNPQNVALPPKKKRELEEEVAGQANEEHPGAKKGASCDDVHPNESHEKWLTGGGCVTEEVVQEGAEKKDEWTININGKDHKVKCDQCTKVEATSQAQAKLARAKRGAASVKQARLKDQQKENWTRGSKDELLFERLVKKWAK